MRERFIDLLFHLRDPLYRNGYLLVMNAGITSALGFIYWLLVARLFTAEDVGRASALISSIIFLSAIAQLGLRPAMGRLVPVAGARTAPLVLFGYLASAAVAVTVGLAFALVVPLLVRGELEAVVAASPLHSAVVVVSVLFWSLFNLEDGVLTGLRRAEWVAISNALFAIAKIGFAVFLGITTMRDWTGILLSWVVPMGVTVLLVGVLLFYRFIPQHAALRPESSSLIRLGPIIRFTVPDYLGYLFVLAYPTLLPVMVIAQLAPASAAHFYIVWLIASTLQLVPLQLVVSLTVETAAAPDSFHTRARRLLLQIARILVPVGVVLMVGAPFILGAFGAGYAESGSDPLRLLILGLAPFTINVLYFGYARVQARTRGILAGQAFLALSILGLSALLLPRVGLVGVGLAYLLGQTCLALTVSATALRSVLTSPRNIRPT
jgi:O-antigen/teichoic acid export membrane protein